MSSFINIVCGPAFDLFFFLSLINTICGSIADHTPVHLNWFNSLFNIKKWVDLLKSSCTANRKKNSGQAIWYCASRKSLINFIQGLHEMNWVKEERLMYLYYLHFP